MYPNSLYVLKLRYSLKQDHKEFTYFTNKLNQVIIFTLFLGSWWALQEGSWGGWWNWDPSEVFGMLVMLFYLNSLHRKSCTENHIYSLYYINLLWKFILLTYVFIQFNFDLVSHNFGTRVDQFIDSSHNFLLLLLFLSLIISWNYTCFIYVSVSTNNLLINTVHAYSTSWNLLLYSFILSVILSSFSLLINDFFWKTLQVNILNSVKLTYYFTPVLVTLLFLRTWDPIYTLPIFYYALNNSIFTTVLMTLSLRPTNLMIFHNSVIVILLGMCVEYNQTLSLWDIIAENVSLQLGNLTSDLFGTTISLNNFFIEYAKLELLNNSLTECVWNIVWASSSPENHNFAHLLTSYHLGQILLSGNTLSQYLITVLDLALTSTTVMLIPLSYLFARLISKIKIIVF